MGSRPPGCVNYKKGCTQLTAASDKVYQLLAHGRWFSPGTPASSTTKTGRHDIAEILLKVALNTINHKSINTKQVQLKLCKSPCHFKRTLYGIQWSRTTSSTNRYQITDVYFYSGKIMWPFSCMDETTISKRCSDKRN